MRGSTRKKLKKFLGEGFHGKVYTISYLHEQLAHQDIRQIELYTEDVNEPLTLSCKDDIRAFIQFLGNLDNVIAKVYKDIMAFTAHKMTEEIGVNARIVKGYGVHAKKYLTIGPIRGFRKPFYGSAIYYYDKSPMFALFSTMCLNKFVIQPKKFLHDILESLAVLQRAGYQHNDIKLDNIVICDGRYKLIDWGQCSKLDEFAMGDMVSTSPVKWYLAGVPAFISDRAMNIRARTLDVGYEESGVFQETFERIEAEFFEVVNGGSLERFRKSFDIFMVGMTLLRCIYNDSLDAKKYLPVVNALTSLKHPVTNPKKALTIVSKLLG